MIDEELVWQQREITGESAHACERCGRPVGANLLRQAADDTTADGGGGMRICADCQDAIVRGMAPLDLDEDELEPER